MYAPVGNGDEHDGHGGEFEIELGEHLFELGDDLDHDERQNSDGHGDHDDRVDHGPFDFSPEGLGPLLEVGQPLEDDFEGPTGLTGLDHVDVQAIEALGTLGHRLGEGGAGFDVVAGVLQRVLEPPRLGLAFENPQAAENRQAGVLENRELPREGGQVLSGHAAEDETPFLLLPAPASDFLRPFLTAILVTK